MDHLVTDSEGYIRVLFDVLVPVPGDPSKKVDISVFIDKGDDHAVRFPRYPSLRY